MNRPQDDAELTGDPYIDEELIADMHAEHMAEWAEVELTPERWDELRKQADQELIDAVHPPNETPPWEED